MRAQHRWLARLDGKPACRCGLVLLQALACVCLDQVCLVLISDGLERRGVCTNYLAALEPGDRVSAFLRSTPFKLPPSPATPVILVGAGTGMAPLRGMIAHLSALKQVITLPART